jgi:acetylornithine deacetylase
MSSVEDTIAEAVGQRADRIVEVLCDIVRFPSIVKSDPREAGPGERDCQLYLQKRRTSASPSVRGRRGIS